jgi:hypothetical protein
VTGAPTAALVLVYERWGRSGAGLLVTGHVIVDASGRAEVGNTRAEERNRAALRRWAEAAQGHGAALWMQINHAGRQAPRRMTRQPLAPSAVPMKGFAGLFAAPRALTEAEIDGWIARFAPPRSRGHRVRGRPAARARHRVAFLGAAHAWARPRVAQPSCSRPRAAAGRRGSASSNSAASSAVVVEGDDVARSSAAGVDLLEVGGNEEPWRYCASDRASSRTAGVLPDYARRTPPRCRSSDRRHAKPRRDGRRARVARDRVAGRARTRPDPRQPLAGTAAARSRIRSIRAADDALQVLVPRPPHGRGLDPTSSGARCGTHADDRPARSRRIAMPAPTATDAPTKGRASRARRGDRQPGLPRDGLAEIASNVTAARRSTSPARSLARLGEAGRMAAAHRAVVRRADTAARGMPPANDLAASDFQHAARSRRSLETAGEPAAL